MYFVVLRLGFTNFHCSRFNRTIFIRETVNVMVGRAKTNGENNISDNNINKHATKIT